MRFWKLYEVIFWSSIIIMSQMEYTEALQINKTPGPLRRKDPLTAATGSSSFTINDHHIDIESDEESSDSTEEFLHSGILKSEPNSDSSGSTVPFHKLNRKIRLKKGTKSLDDKYRKFGILPEISNSSANIDFFTDILHSVQSKQKVAEKSMNKKHATLKKRKNAGKMTNKNVTVSRKKRQAELLVKQELGVFPSCGIISDEKITKTPLMCYQCRSMSKNEDPSSCDSELWPYLRNSEKYSKRIRCPENRGHFCVKSVGDKGGGERKTIRGCYGAGPLTAKNGKEINLREGCISYIDGGYWTKTCFCQKDLCNQAPNVEPGGNASIISAIIVCWALVMYGFCYASLSR